MVAGLVFLGAVGAAQAAEFRVEQFGAKGDGSTVDTQAIQKAIDAAAKEGGTVVFRPGVYWNPSYSYAKMPEGVTDAPDYWKVLTEPVPPEKGLPHLRGVRISNIQATGARTAFSVTSYADSPLRDFQFQNLEIDAKTAGTIQFAEGWTLDGARIRTEDGSRVTVMDSRDVKGLPER